MNSKPSRFIIVDDHPLARAGIINFLSIDTSLKIVGEAGGIEEARKLLSHAKPDLMLLDLSLGNHLAFDFIKEVRASFPKTQILVLSMLDERAFGGRALRAGAVGFVMKDVAAENLLSAVGTVQRGGVFYSAGVLRAAVNVPRENNEISSLSDRELEVFRLIGQAHKVASIAAALGISPRTVDAHKQHIKDKLNLSTSAELGSAATRWLEQQSSTSP